MHRLSRDPFVIALLALAALSVLVWPLAFINEAHLPPKNAPKDFITYFQAVNFWPFPFFFLALIPVLYLTWQSFFPAWRDLARTNVLLIGDEAPDARTTTDILTDIDKLRYLAVIVAAIAALIINAIDLQGARSAIFGAQSAVDQAEWACATNNLAAKWIFEQAAASGNQINCFLQYFEAFEDQPPFVIAPGYAAFLICLALQQIAIVFIAALAFGQLLLHTLVFGWLEHVSPTAKRTGATITLNATSPMREFGLEHWNHALNNFYWASCPALLGVFMSRIATAPENYLPGQNMLGWIVPALLIAPMVLTILVRQKRLPAMWHRLDATTGEERQTDHDAYHSQQLWPLDRNWSSKLGIILAFLLASLALGMEINRLIPL